MTEEEYYARIKAEYENSTDAKLVAWAQPYFDGTKKPNGKDKYIICPVSERAAQDIFELTGSDVHGFNHVLRGDEISHINKRHGKHGKADRTMQDINDLGRLAYVFYNYDEIIATKKQSRFFLNKLGKHADCLLFIKRINGQVVIAEAVTDSIKNKALFVETVYKARTSAFSTQKKESTIDGNNPRPNVQNEIDSITSILPQPEKNVNSLDKNNTDDKPKPPTFAEIAEQNKNYRPPRKPRSSGNDGNKKPPNKGSTGR